MSNASEIFNEITNTQFQCLCNLGQCFHRDLVFGSLNVSNIIACQIRLFGKLFLAQTGFGSFGSYRFAKDFGYFAALRHSLKGNQEHSEGTTKHTWYFPLAANCENL